jgi:hypothetical protein
MAARGDYRAFTGGGCKWRLLTTLEPAMRHLTRVLRPVLGTCVLLGSLLLAGCVSPGGYGGYPDGYGRPDQGYPSQYGSQVQGTVDSLDTGYGRILLVVDDPRGGRGQRTEVRYDQRTRLFHQGRESSVEGLERGDVVRIDVAQSGRELWARQVEVLRDVREGGYGGGGYGGSAQELRGAVALVDTRARVIRLDGAGYGGGVQLRYDDRTTVQYQGRSYRPADMQRGDIVRIQARQVGNNQWLAERIFVERSAQR